jgi:hypothetical protein
MSARGILVALATAGLVILPACKPKPNPRSTKLEIEITGGFAFVASPSQKMLEVAYLNDVEMTDPDGSVSCSVKQIGTELIVVRGGITEAEPPAPEDGIFNLSGWVVNFPALDKAKIDFDGFRESGLPSPLVAGTGSWESQKYVPSIKDHHPGLKIKKDWQSLVSGWVVLKGGRIVGAVPTDPLMQHATFDYQLAGTSIAKTSITDKMIYTVNVPGEGIEVVFTNRKTQDSKRLVLAAPAKDKPVRLILRGLHSMPMTASYATRIELADYCAFYSLLDGGAAIPKNKRLRLFYESPSPTQIASFAPQSLGGNPAQPSPGFYCSGDWP